MAQRPSRSVRARLVRTLVLLVLVAAACVALLMLFEEHLIYFPSRYPQGRWDPAAGSAGAAPVRLEDCWLEAADGVKLHGWYCRAASGPGPGAPPPVLLWLHGNAGNITHRYEGIVNFVRLPAEVFIIDYRGYGRSSGRPGESGLSLDAAAAWQYLVAQRGVDAGRIVVLGRSLGAAVAVALVRDPAVIPAGLIVESAFTSVPDMVAGILPIFPRGLIRTRMDSLSMIGAITCPKLFVHSDADEIVPYAHGRRLFDAAAEPKRFHRLRGIGHNDTDVFGGPAYLAELADFVAACTRPAPAAPEPDGSGSGDPG